MRGEMIMDNTKRVWYRVMDGENIVGYMFKVGQTCEYEERVVAVIAFPALYSEVNVVVDNVESMKWMADVLAKKKRVILTGTESYVGILLKQLLY